MPCTGAIRADTLTVLIAALTAKLVSTWNHIVNYSSEFGDQFMPDSIGSKDSPFDIGELIDSVLGQTAFFGANRHEQSENQQEAFEDIFEKLSEGAKVGNTYFQSFMQHRVQD